MENISMKKVIKRIHREESNLEKLNDILKTIEVDNPYAFIEDTSIEELSKIDTDAIIVLIPQIQRGFQLGRNIENNLRFVQQISFMDKDEDYI